jgi:leucyl aminopeptidase
MDATNGKSRVDLVAADAALGLDADLLALPYLGVPTAAFRRLDAAVDGRLSRLVSAGEARAEAGAAALVHADGVASERVALFGVGDLSDADELRAGAASAARSAAALGGRLAWIFDDAIRLDEAAHARAIVEGALLGSHDPGRWKTTAPAQRLEQLTIAGAPPAARPAVARAEIVARWTNRARELVDAPPNEVTPAGLADAALALLDAADVAVDVLGRADLERLGLRALCAVGAGSANEPRLIALRSGSGQEQETIGLVGKAITFDSGGFFLKGQSDIVRQKADMGGGAAVIAAVGAIAELGVPLNVFAAVPAAENLLGSGAYRPGDIVTTAAGLTVEVTNPDAEGRLVMADALWYCRQHGASRLIDVATLTGAMRAGMGDLYSGVFANDDSWRDELVAAGAASGDHAWPWPMHRRYRRLLDSPLADLRNTAGRSFGYPIIAATFLERFVGDLPWAHVDIQSTAYLDEERDYFRRGATGAGVRLLVELAERISTATGS